MEFPRFLQDAMEIPESDDAAFDDLLLVKAYNHAIGAACNSDIEKLLSVKHSGTDSTPALNKPSPSSTQNQPKVIFIYFDTYAL